MRFVKKSFKRTFASAAASAVPESTNASRTSFTVCVIVGSFCSTPALLSNINILAEVLRSFSLSGCGFFCPSVTLSRLRLVERRLSPLPKIDFDGVTLSKS